MYEEIKNLYKKANVIRRFRQVKDGLWIYPKEPLQGYGRFKGGIWVNKYDYENNKKYYLNTYLIEVDDELRRALENIKMERNKNLKKRYTIISKDLSSKFAHDERYRYRGMVFTLKKGAEWHLNNLPYAQQRNMKVVSFIPKQHEEKIKWH